MARAMTRREFAAVAGAVTLAIGSKARAEPSAARTLRFIAQSDLRVLDPIWTTAYITRNHGYMVFDTLFALDAEFTPHPQMIGDYNISPDKLSYNSRCATGSNSTMGSRCAAPTVSPRCAGGWRVTVLVRRWPKQSTR